jgi:hypothetical protein
MSKTDGGRPVSIEILEPAGGQVELERSQVAKVEQTSKRLWQRFNGSVGLGAI